MQLARFCPRFTVRRLMVAVAIVGLVLGTGRWLVVMRARSAEYQSKAFELVLNHGYAQINLDVYTKDGRRISIYHDENYWRAHTYRSKMASKYWRLSLRPWLAAGPDPPPPEPLAHPRPPADCPAELTLGDSRPCGLCALNPWYNDPVYPWWTIPWTWPPRRYSLIPRYSFP
jgi:hypothetical protein